MARRSWIMSALLLATVLASLDSSFAPLAFPDMIDDLDTSTGVVVWVALGYLIAATGPMLFMARIGDVAGYSVIFRLGTVLYGAAMALCALMPDIESLIGMRLAQGLGMALFLPATFSIATRVYPPLERGKALGLLASGNAFGFILGPIFAGWLLDSYDWRAIFWSRIPLALAAAALALAVVRRRGLEPGEASGAALDWKGALYLTASLFGVLFGLNRLPVEDNHLDPAVWAVGLAGLLLGVLFVRHERRHEHPLIEVGLYLSHPDFAKASIAFTALFASFPVYLFILPLLLISGLELRAWDAGMLLAVVAVITFVVSPIAGRLADRFGAALPASFGALLVMAGYLSMLPIGPESAAAAILPPMLLIGLGCGLFFSPNNSLIMAGVPPARSGMAAGMIGTMRQAGYALGFALMASLFTVVQNGFESAWMRHGLGLLQPQAAAELSRLLHEGGIWSPEVLTFIFHLALLVSAALLLVTTLYSLPRLRFSAGRHLVAIGASLLVAVLGVSAWVYGADDRMRLEGRGGGSQLEPSPPPSAFGMVRREPVEVPSWAPPVLESGREVFVFYCSDCHGLDARGVPKRGVDLHASSFLRQIGNAELRRYLREGRQADDPRNRTGQVMTGMGIFPTFTEQNYDQVIRYLRETIR